MRKTWTKVILKLGKTNVKFCIIVQLLRNIVIQSVL